MRLVWRTLNSFFPITFSRKRVGQIILFRCLLYLIYLITHSLYQYKPHVFPKIKVFTMWTPLKSILRRSKLWWKKPPGTPLLCLLLKQSENKTSNRDGFFNSSLLLLNTDRRVETKLILLKYSIKPFLCRKGWGVFNVPGARNEYNALNPHCLNSIYASEGRRHIAEIFIV